MTKRSLLVLTWLVWPMAVRAQTKDQMIADWTRHRALVLAYIDAMPDSAVGLVPTGEPQSFAAQVESAANASADAAARAIRALPQVPFTADTAQTRHQKAALRAHVAQSYDYVLDAVRGATPAQLARMVTLDGTTRSGARWIAAAEERTVWTLGATQCHLRAYGVTPPPP